MTFIVQLDFVIDTPLRYVLSVTSEADNPEASKSPLSVKKHARVFFSRRSRPVRSTEN